MASAAVASQSRNRGTATRILTPPLRPSHPGTPRPARSTPKSRCPRPRRGWHLRGESCDFEATCPEAVARSRSRQATMKGCVTREDFENGDEVVNHMVFHDMVRDNLLLLLYYVTVSALNRGTVGEQRHRQRRDDQTTRSRARQQQRPSLGEVSHFERGDRIGRERDRLSRPRDVVASLELHRGHGHQKPRVAVAEIPPSHEEHARSQIACKIRGALVRERRRNVAPWLGARCGERMVVVTARREAQGEPNRGTHRAHGSASLPWQACTSPLLRNPWVVSWVLGSGMLVLVFRSACG